MKFQVGDPVKDHECWVKPENMKTPRTVLKIDQNAPGTEIAAETSAALAAASIVFKNRDKAYNHILLNKARVVGLMKLIRESIELVVHLYMFFTFLFCSFLSLPRLTKEPMMESAPSTALIQATM